uniref:Major sperm protein n=1 Tax=Globodera pallida TaxID=36090 RepID=A0A183BR40_GLOPA
MEKNQIFELTPNDVLTFKGKLGHIGSVQLTIKNCELREIYFKVKSTASRFYSVRPDTGMIKPYGRVKVIVQPNDDSLAKLDEIEASMHKFLIMAAVASDLAVKSEEFWKGKKESTEGVYTTKLKTKVHRASPHQLKMEHHDASGESSNSLKPENVALSDFGKKDIEAPVNVSSSDSGKKDTEKPVNGEMPDVGKQDMEKPVNVASSDSVKKDAENPVNVASSDSVKKDAENPVNVASSDSGKNDTEEPVNLASPDSGKKDTEKPLASSDSGKKKTEKREKVASSDSGKKDTEKPVNLASPDSGKKKTEKPVNVALPESRKKDTEKREKAASSDSGKKDTDQGSSANRLYAQYTAEMIGSLLERMPKKKVFQLRKELNEILEKYEAGLIDGIDG